MDPTAPTPESLAAAILASPERDKALLALRSRVASGELPSAILADVGLVLLASLREGDGIYEDMAWAGLLLDHGEARHLAPLQALRPKLRARTGLRDWRLEVSRAIAAIAERARGGCDCVTEASSGVPPYGGRWEVLSQRDAPEVYGAAYEVKCARCGRPWHVVEEGGYHYPIFRWSNPA